MLRWIFNRFRRKRIIVIAPRGDDIWAGMEDKTGVWGAGKSSYAALGDLVFHHQKDFGVEIRTAFGDRPHQPLDGAYVTISEGQYDALMSKAGWSRK